MTTKPEGDSQLSPPSLQSGAKSARGSGRGRLGKGRWGRRPGRPIFVNPRFAKLWRDLTLRRTRTILVVVSIAVGVFGLGVITGTRQILDRELAAGFAAINPASATFTTIEPFGNDFVESIESMREVGVAEGRSSVLVRVETEPGVWRDVQLNVIPDFENIKTDRVSPDAGAWPPPERELLVERSALRLVGAEVGDILRIKMPDGRLRDMKLAGTAHDLFALLYALDGVAWGYVTFDTLEWLGHDRSFNELRIVPAEGRDNREHVEEVAKVVRDKIENSGRSIYFMSLPEPGQHPLSTTIQAILLLLGAMGALALGLSGLLVTNTISAIVVQETRQIGIMKTIGARQSQIVWMYLGLVAAYGVLAILVAVPLGMLGTRAFTLMIAGFLNFDIESASMPPSVILLQVSVAILVPIVAALPPVLKGSRISVRQAIAAYGLGQGRFGTGRTENLVQRILDRVPRLMGRIPRPTLLSLRNTFRRKGRLALTLTTLTVAGSIFMGIFSIRESLLGTLDEVLEIWQYDLWVMLEHPYRSDHLTSTAMSVPGVVDAEGWGFASTRLVRKDGEDELGDAMFGFIIPTMLMAPPAETELLAPTMLRGRWLLPEDDNAIVVNSEVLKRQPGVDLGDTVTLKLGGRDSDWVIVGVAQSPFPSPIVYVPYPHYARTTNDAERAGTMMVLTAEHDLSSQLATATELEDALQRAGVDVTGIFKMAEERSEAESTFTSIITLLLMVAVLLAVVGGLGLMGTMSLNVIERTREIGVMRAIGASTRSVLQIVIVEGALIGGMSWALGAIFSIPLTIVLGNAIGNALLQIPLSFTFSVTGAVIWLATVMILSLVASLTPAWNASRVSVQESLAYE